MRITSGSEVNNRTIKSPNSNTPADTKIEIMDDIFKVATNPDRTRSILPAPIFCPTNVDSAAEKFIAGSDANESILAATENAAITLVPKRFTILINAIIPTATKVCCIPVGRPIRMLFRKISLSNARLLKLNLIILCVLFK